jgi:hypothetical protein
MTSLSMSVYGVFTKANICLYVGHTSTPRTRAAIHKRRFPGCEFRILHKCNNGDGCELEKALIRKFRAIGQCQFNIKSTRKEKHSPLNRRYWNERFVTVEKRNGTVVIVPESEYETFFDCP